MRRLALLAALLLALPASAQSYVDGRPGPFGSLDLVGGAFPGITPAGVDASGGLGYRLGNGADAAVLLGWGGAVADTLFPYPAELHLGAAVGLTVGPGRAPWRFELVGLASVTSSDRFTFPAGGGPTVVGGGGGVVESRGRVSAVRYLRVADGGVRVLVGGGLYASARRHRASVLVFQAGGPDEHEVGGEDRTETSVGVQLSVPVAVDLGRGARLVLDPALRIDTWAVVYYGVGDGQVTLRLNL